MLTAALAYAEDGLPVFPCGPRGKRPIVEGGFKVANVNTEQIRGWWSSWRLADIGIPTGAVSGFVVLDVHPGGEALLADLEGQYGSLSQTRTVKNERGRRSGSSTLACPFRAARVFSVVVPIFAVMVDM